MSTKNIGNKGENIAISYLLHKKHTILEKNFRTNFGEIDIISRYKNSIYIFEVKYRKNLEYGYGDNSITKSKINKITKTFEIWLTKNYKYKDYNFYLNALVIDPDGKINEFEIL